MLQRIQTLYLFLAFLALIFIGIFPILSLEPVSGDPPFPQPEKLEIRSFENLYMSLQNPNHIDRRDWEYPNLAIWIVSTGLLLVCIFLYKNRKLQTQVCWAILGFILILSALIYLDINTIKDTVPARSLGIGAYSISASLLFILLARKQIVKDENLVRSVDRLR